MGKFLQGNGHREVWHFSGLLLSSKSAHLALRTNDCAGYTQYVGIYCIFCLKTYFSFMTSFWETWSVRQINNWETKLRNNENKRHENQEIKKVYASYNELNKDEKIVWSKVPESWLCWRCDKLVSSNLYFHEWLSLYSNSNKIVIK